MRSVEGIARFQNNFMRFLKSMNVKHLPVCQKNVLHEQVHELMTCTQMIGTTEFVSRQCDSVKCLIVIAYPNDIV